MEDRFRFRGWLIEEKRMIIIDCMDVKMEKAWEDDLHWPSSYEIDNEIIPMQCTGLKDKNGDLIYEGDKVHSKHLGSAEIVMGNGAFWVHSPMHGVHLVADNHEACEIVGNIYEQPDPVENDQSKEYTGYYWNKLYQWLCNQIKAAYEAHDPSRVGCFESMRCEMNRYEDAEKSEYTCKDCDWVRGRCGNVVCEPVNCYESRKTTLDTPACTDFMKSK